MSTVASPFQNPFAGELGRAIPDLTLAIRIRRKRQRRQMLALVAANYSVNTLILLMYAAAGTIPLIIAPIFAACGIAAVSIFTVLSEAGINDKFRDHYFVVPQAVLSAAFMLSFAYAVPQIGFMFLSTLFVVFSFSSLRSSQTQTALIWTFAVFGLAALFLLTGTQISIPLGSPVERAVTMLTFVLSTGQCMILGIFSSAMRETLYKRGIELKAAYKRIEELAELDDLTGAYNRRCIMRLLDSEIARAQRSNSPCSVALIDLDWFKRINDAFGHPTGDEVLRAFAITMFANIREIDKFGRYGGEEFLLILPGTTNDAATRSLDRLREIIAQLDWSAFDPAMSVTISAGVATLTSNETPDAILARADSALYTAKAGGRNQIASA